MDSFADRILPWKIFLGKHVVDDDHGRSMLIVLPRNKPSAEQSEPHRLLVARVSQREERGIHVVGVVGLCLAIDPKRICGRMNHWPRAKRNGRRRHSRNIANDAL